MAIETQVRERPILFSDRLVRAILDGRKTQTRRVVKPNVEPCECMFSDSGWARAGEPNEHGVKGCTCSPIAMPYGQPGDRLYIREAWKCDFKATDLARIVYRASLNHAGFNDAHEMFDVELAADTRVTPDRWRPSIHMPKWASRITLEVTGVRAERLQEITDRDIDAEGLLTDEPRASYRRALFAEGWDRINGRRGYTWASNPWVWVVEFRRVQP